MSASILKTFNVHLQGNPQAKETLILAHGYGSEQRAWRFLMPAFKDRYRIVLFDWMGCGASDYASYNFNLYTSLHAYADDLIKICDTLQIKSSVMFCHSVSSMIAAIACNERPEMFSKLVFIGASPRYLNDGEYQGGFDQPTLDSIFTAMNLNYAGWAQGFSPAAMNAPETPAMTHEFLSSLSAMRPDISLALARVIFMADHRSDIAKLKIPVLLLQMQQDLVVPESVAKYMQSVIPNSQLRMLQAHGHFPHMSQPAEVTQVISDYLQ